MTPVRNHPLCTLQLSLVLLLVACCCDVQAARLVSVDILDREYLVVNISDGDVVHQDEVNKVEQVLRYTPELDKSAAAQTGNWTISSADDSGYGPDGRIPLSCSRKTKLSGHAEMGWSGSDYVYEYTYEHWIYLQLPSPLQQGASYQLAIDASINSDSVEESFTFNIFNSVSEAIHVNLVGYSPDAPHKAADLYHWLGSGGPRDYSSFEGNTVYLHNVATGAAQAVGTVQFWKQSGTDVFNYNLTGSDVWAIDFSGAAMPGTYRLVVDGVGCSQDFEIAEDAYHAPYAVSLLGYFYMRIGEGNPKDISPPPRTPLYIPGQSPADTTVYLTTMQPYHPNWSTFTDGDKWDKPSAWVPYVKSTPPTTNPNAWGGHSDAADWDRHLGHVVNIYDLLLPYLMSDGAIDDDDLGITESGNGIPDIIDEARNEVDFWLRLRDGAGYSHGLTNPNGSNELFQAGPTPIAAWANAANAAMLADAFRIAGRSDLMTDHQDAAAEAYTHASSLTDQMLDEGLDLDDGRLRGRDLKMMAAAFLYNVTGDTAYEDAIFSESVCSGGPATLNNSGRNQLYGTAAYLITPRPIHYPALQDAMRTQIVAEAKSTEADLMNSRPSRRATYNPPGYWRTAHFVTRTIIAHAVTESQFDRDYLRTALNLEADWSLGRNPLNMIEMTTATTVLASKRSVQESYTSGRYDGVPGVHPGHTPYMNLDDWDPGMTMGTPSKLMQDSYPGNVLATWPRGETYYPSRWVWAHNEFTPRQTMRGKMALYGYLAAIAEPAGPPVAVTGVSLIPETLIVNGSDSSQLTATIAPADATNRLLDWESSDPTVATVDAGGRVRGVSPGTATVTVTTVDGSFTDSCTVTVSDVAVTGITVTPASVTIPEGASETLAANVMPDNAINQTISWSSDAVSVASVSQNGIVSGNAAGTATITATTEDGGFVDSCLVTVEDIPEELVVYRDVGGMALNTWAQNGTLTELTGGGQEGSKQYRFTYNFSNWWAGLGFNISPVDISSYEKLVIAINGPTAASNHASVTLSDVNEVDSETYELTRTTDYALLEIPVSSLAGSTGIDLTAIRHMMISVGGSQTASGTLYFDNIYFGGSIPQVPVTGVTVTPASAVIDGDTVQLHAAVSPSNATDTSVTWSSSNDSVASVNDFGHVLGHALGSATITATTGDGGFTDTADITVTTPTVGRVIKVMPLGDSITEGYTIPGGYRLKFWQNLENDGLDCGVDLVGTLNNNSVAGLDDPDHEGHSGWTTGQILAGIDSYLAVSTPDVVMMHLGTNDIAQDTVAEAPANLRGLIDHICAALPADGRLYVAKIIPMGGVGNPDSLAYNDMIVAAVTEKQNEGLPVYLVDAATIWSNDLYSNDWTHPNQQGYNALGDFWFDVVRDDVQLPCGGVVTIPGDVNNDGSVDLADAISALKVLTGNQTGAVKEADINGDGAIGMEEAVYILQRESTPP
ncbi:Ig-like domain-containing protein [Desulfofustis glycolicus]|uniref:N-terminal ig-like domain of cellulase n=1 Tax=Desulfofustis glycolicus DSM 9705 TaxID=1121409 RepID=A0A1M5XSA5_9BACT|nr:Ig-like domain-containing protein [Desulfofustis glycolicus]SHI02153.1 N-terminal ig-like domain of cellulase [Desulfofustis glycolicus DSM 9705]